MMKELRNKILEIKDILTNPIKLDYPRDRKKLQLPCNFLRLVEHNDLGHSKFELTICQNTVPQGREDGWTVHIVNDQVDYYSKKVEIIY